jgi:branched-chain amino acid transport system substrate-binding protein
MAIANQLVGKNVAVVIGHMCSGSSIPASKVYAEEGVLMISPSATSPLLTEQKLTNVFRTCGRDDQQGDVVAQYMAKKFAGKNLAIVQDKTAYGQGLAEQVQKTLRAAGQSERLYESITRGERDYSTLIAKLKEHDIAAVFYGGYHTEAGLIVRQMRGQGLKTILISDDDLTTRQFWDVTGDAGEGTLFSFNIDPRGKPEAADAVKRIRAKGFDPEGTTLYTYAAVEVAVDAMKRAGVPHGEKLLAAMHDAEFKTVLGSIKFDAKGDVTKPDYILYQWSKGSYAPLDERMQ